MQAQNRSANRQQVGIGQLKIGASDDQLEAVLGSCVGIALIWKEGGRCGLAHCLSHGEILAMCKGHASLYPDEGKPKNTLQGGARRTSGRHVYITFVLNAAYAVEIRQVREIIDFSDAITCPPGMPDYMRGMLNLRQQMVTLIDLRRLYGMPALHAGQPPKVLIIERGADCCGLIADAVDSIMTIDDSKRFAAPSLMRKPQTDSDHPARKTLRVFDCDKVLRTLQTSTVPGIPAA